jgi:hypothetical protein
MNRPEARRSRENDVVDVGLEQLLVRVQPDETVILGDRRRIGMLLRERLATLIKTIPERVRERDDAHAGGRFEHVPCGTGAPTATADETNANLVTASRVSTNEPIEPRYNGRRHRGCGSTADEIAARRSGTLLFSHGHTPRSVGSIGRKVEDTTEGPGR